MKVVMRYLKSREAFKSCYFSLGGNLEIQKAYERFVWANPFNFEAVEKLIVILLKWIYKPILQSYSKDLKLGRVPQSAEMNLVCTLILCIKMVKYIG
jgi:nucleosome binding factor SPN SPT16 subunit